MTDLTRQFLTSPWIPWRVRIRLERLLEIRLRERCPPLYRLLHHGRMRDVIQPLTTGPRHHFFGYYEKSPWSASGQRVLAHEVDFNNRPPCADDEVAIGYVDVASGHEYRAIAATRAWNWQQGSMLQWHPGDSDRLLVHNDQRNGVAFGVIRDLEGNVVGELERPVYAISPDVRYAYSVSFSRLHAFRPGYGYAGLHDSTLQDLHPGGDGLFRTRLNTGECELLVSLEQLARSQTLLSMEGQPHWLNHVQVSPSGRRVAFFHTWSVGEGRWAVRLYVFDNETGELRIILDTGSISHYDWRDDDSLLVWATRPDGAGKGFLLVDVATGQWRVVGEDVLVEDGHCSFSPDGRCVLNDTYQDQYDMRTLMMYRWPEGPRIDLARLYSPRSVWPGEIRCDFHPRWSRDGRQICIDSVHDGSRQIYVVDVAGMAG